MYSLSVKEQKEVDKEIEKAQEELDYFKNGELTDNDPTIDRDLVTYQPIADMFGCSTYQIKKLWKQGKIREAKMGYWSDYKVYYPLFSYEEIMRTKDEIRPLIKIRKSHIQELPITKENIAESLYIINKSAKKSRDSKQANYYRRSYGITAKCKERESNLYDLKDKVLNKLLEENIAKIKGYHTQKFERYYTEKVYLNEFGDPIDEDSMDEEDMEYCDYRYEDKSEIETNYLLLIELCGFTYHKPTYELNAKKYNYLGEIDIISAESKVKTKIKYTEAINILNKYYGEENIEYK